LVDCRPGHESRNHPAHHGDSEGKQQDPAIQRHPCLVRHVKFRHEQHDAAHQSEREQHAEDAAREGQYHAFRQQLSHQPTAARAEGQAHRHLAAPAGTARELQVGHIRAGDQQEKADRAKQRLQARAHRAARHGHVQIVIQPRDKSVLRETSRALLCLLLHETEQLLGGHFLGDPRLETNDLADATLQIRRGHGQPEAIVGVPAEARRHDADDHVRLVIEHDGSAQGRWVAVEETLPKLEGKHRHRFGLTARLDVGWHQTASENRGHSKELKGRAGHPGSGDDLRVYSARQRRAVVTGRHRGSHPGQAGNFLVIGQPQPDIAIRFGIGDLRHPDLSRPRVRVRFEQHAVNDAEHCCGHSDAQGQRDYRDGGKSARFGQCPARIGEVLDQLLEPHPAPLLPRLLLDRGDVAELSECGVARVGRGHTRLHIQLDLQLDVLPHFVGHFDVDAIALE
jgi:hypothetical protein